MMDVTAFHDDVMKRRNMVHDAKHHAPHNGKGQKEADGRDKQPASWTFGDVLAQKSAKTSAAKNKEQGCHRCQQNRQENPIAMHGPLELDGDVAVILRKRSPSRRE